MMLRSTLLALVLAPTLAGCVHIYEPRPAGAPAAPAGDAASKKDDKKDPFKPWDDVLKDTKKIEGLLPVHLKRDQTVYLELAPSDLDRDLAMTLHISRGVGDMNIHDGLPLSDAEVIRFRRVGDKVYLVARNPRFTAAAGSPMKNSLDDNVGHSILEAFKIESEHKETKKLLVDVTPFLLSDYGDIGGSLKDYFDKKPASLDKERSFVSNVAGFPKNLEIDVELTLRAPDPLESGTEALSDWRSIPVGIRYSIYALPEKPMTPRHADDRVGHFLTVHEDFSRDRMETPYVRFVNRWRLEKKDPAAKVSEPVQPIVYWIDRSVPHEFRKWVKEGIEGWNKAFEAAGFKNAIVAKEAPENDPTWSAEDVRYSTVRWTAAHRMGYAIGPSEVDPRTGEILNADVLISSTFVRGWLFDYEEMTPKGAMSRFRSLYHLDSPAIPGAAEHRCLAEMGMAHQLSVASAVLAGTAPGGGMPDEYLGEAIRELILHEVGHTLGLRHNFRGSGSIDADRLHDRDYTRLNGVATSVMDYNPVNLSVDPKKQGHWFNPEPGAYDLWAITYAYSVPEGGPAATPEAELPHLEKIARRSGEPLLAYGTDEDNWLGPFAVDPLTSAWELGDDVARYANERVQICEAAQPTLEKRLIEDGEGYQRLRGAVTRLLFEKLSALSSLTKTIGGSHVSRHHKGDPGAKLPFVAVPAQTQRAALATLVDRVFSEESLRFDPALLSRLAPNRYSHWGVRGSLTPPVDFPVHEWTATYQEMILDQLLAAPKLARMIDTGARLPAGEKPFAVSELLGTLTGASFSEILGTAKPVDSFRRNLQRMVVHRYADLLFARGEDPAPPDARALARFELERIAAAADKALAGKALDVETRAHLGDLRRTIGRSLDAQVVFPVTARPASR